MASPPKSRFLSSTEVVLLTLISVLHVCNAAPLSHPHSSSRAVLRQTSGSQCSFEGSTDLYGLGIRIGLYLQWFTGLLANCFLAESVLDYLATNTIFLLALFTALAIITAQNTVRAAEVIILSQFCFGFLSTVLTIWGLRVRARVILKEDDLKEDGSKKNRSKEDDSKEDGSKKNRSKEDDSKEDGQRVYFSLVGSTVRVCLASAISFYNVWFWFVGADMLSSSSCDSLAFLFVPVNILGDARIFFKIVAVLLAVIFGFTAIAELLLFVCNWVSYCVISITVALVVTFQRIFPMDKSPPDLLAILELWLKYIPAALVVAPWILANSNVGVGISRLQSWFIIGSATVVVSLWFLHVVSTVLDFIWWCCTKPIRLLSVLKPKSLLPGNIPVPSPLAPSESHDAMPSAEETKKNYGNKTEAVSLNQPESIAAEAPSPNSELQHQGFGAGVLLTTNTSQSKKPENNNQAEEPSSSGPPSDSLLSTVKQAIEMPIDFLRRKWKKAERSKFSNNKALRWLPIINLVSLLWSIVAIEFTIKWNSITHVYSIQSVGQLIPFIIGIVGFLQVLRDISVKQCGSWIYKVVLETLLTFDDKSEHRDKTLKMGRQPQTGAGDEDAGTYGPSGTWKKNSGIQIPRPNIDPIPPTKKSTFLREHSIGDQIVSILQSDAAKSETSLAKTRAKLALRLFEEVKAAQVELRKASGQGKKGDKETKEWDEVLKRFHQLDMNPHVLVIRWLNSYARWWWDDMWGNMWRFGKERSVGEAESNHNQTLRNKRTHAAHQMQEEQGACESEDLMHYYIEEYQQMVWTLAEARAAEDYPIDPSGKRKAVKRSKSRQLELELNRQEEDYCELMKLLSLCLKGDEKADTKKALRSRVRDIKRLLEIFDSQRREASERIQEDADRRARERQILDLRENGAEGHNSSIEPEDGTY